MNPLPTAWQTFFAAEVNASAALTGLVVVAVSVNLTRILEHELLPPRAGEALIALVGALVLTSLLLLPGQPVRAQAVECGIGGVVMMAVPFSFQLRAYRSDTPNSRAHPLLRALLSSLGGAPILVAAVLLAEGSGAGLYWAAVGVILSLIAGVVGAWVLLVEILR
ncbi:MAG TPA: hypothetical protein VGF50_07300 [Caulobacteraceae bacterium]